MTTDARAVPAAAPRGSARPPVRTWMRIALAVLAGFLAAGGVAGAVVGTRLARLAEARLESGLRTDLALLVPAVRAVMDAHEPEILDEIAKRASAEGDVRFSFVLADGSVAADSHRLLPASSLAETPEFREALASGSARLVRGEPDGRRRLHLWARVDGPDGRPLGVVRVARALDTTGWVGDELFRVLVAAALAGLPVAALVGWVAARWIARPLEEMTAAATRMAEGDFERLPRVDRSDESGRLAAALQRMGQELSRTLQASESARTELAAILESMVEGVLALDTDERVLHANRSVVECLGLGSVPRPGTPLLEIVRLPEVSAQVTRALGGESTGETDVSLPGPAGRVVAVAAAPARSATGRLRGCVLVVRDVTVIRRLERMRLDFVANVSHELRTPLAAVIGAVETAVDLGEDDAESRTRLLDTALRHGRRLGAIVDDLLALSQIESEGDRLERIPVPVLRTVRAAAASLTTLAAARRVTIDVPPADGPDPLVLGHEGRLELVWTNLLANAVKYNREGGTVRVSIAAGEEDRSALVTVADTGVGIPSEALPRIFERFYRVDKGRSRDQGGTGLGLAIVKHIVRAHRGRIEVESRPGEGTTFRVSIPLAGRSAHDE